MGSYQELIPPEVRHLDEAALDQELLRRGVQFVLDDPVRYVLLSLSRIPVFFTFWPSANSGIISNLTRVLSFGLLWPFMLIGVLGALLKPRLGGGLSSPVALLTLFAVVYTAVHLLSWSLIRYRLPVDAVLLVFAGKSITDLYLTIRSRNKSTSSLPGLPV